MDKKSLFLILLVILIVSPLTIHADQISLTMDNLVTGFTAIGTGVVVIGWIVAGILYLTAAGGPRMEVAKKALIACVIGTMLIIIAATAKPFIAGVFKL